MLGVGSISMVQNKSAYLLQDYFKKEILRLHRSKILNGNSSRRKLHG